MSTQQTEVVHFRVRVDDVEAMREKAAASERTLGGEFRVAVRRYLEQSTSETGQEVSAAA
jgi:hypothetical protein